MENLMILKKAILVSGRGGLWGCEMLRIPHSLDNRLMDNNIIYFVP
jgi:hypothetical protein